MAAADEIMGILETMLGKAPPVALECWDGSRRDQPGSVLTLKVNSPTALRRLLWDPGELGLGRAYVAGELDIEGSVFDLLDLRDRLVVTTGDPSLDLGWRQRVRVVAAARRLGALGRRPDPPPEECRLNGRLHSLGRDRRAVSHHYDVGNDFYRIVLGPSMTYSCALFPDEQTTLEEAQRLKYEHICQKLGLRPGDRLLDVGCGWGGMVLHAARHHGVSAVGITLSEEQARYARRRVDEAGLSGRVDVLRRDYRELTGERFDAISSIGMFEHVGAKRVGTYTETLRRLLRPGGRLLNHAISRPAGEGRLDPDSFVARYVFPDGELHEVGRTVSRLQDLGLEVRDVESLREHYGRTLRHWVANLERSWSEAVAEVGEARARIWLLYMAGSAIGFEAGRINVHQVLAVRTTAAGKSYMPATRPPTPTSLTTADGRDRIDLDELDVRENDDNDQHGHRHDRQQRARPDAHARAPDDRVPGGGS